MSGTRKTSRGHLSTELLILPDGRVLVQNLTPPMAEVLHVLNPQDDTIRPRVEIGKSRKLRRSS